MSHGTQALVRAYRVLDEAAEWDESKHERDKSGRFAPKGGGESGGAAERDDFKRVLRDAGATGPVRVGKDLPSPGPHVSSPDANLTNYEKSVAGYLSKATGPGYSLRDQASYARSASRDAADALRYALVVDGGDSNGPLVTRAKTLVGQARDKEAEIERMSMEPTVDGEPVDLGVTKTDRVEGSDTISHSVRDAAVAGLQKQLLGRPGLKFTPPDDQSDPDLDPRAVSLGTVSFGDSYVKLSAVMYGKDDLRYEATASSERPGSRPETVEGRTPWAALKAAERFAPGFSEAAKKTSAEYDKPTLASGGSVGGFKTGDIVRLTGAHMRSTGSVTGPVDGKVVGAEMFGSLPLLSVKWSDGTEGKINAGSVEYAEREARDAARARSKRTLGESALARYAELTEACCASCEKGGECEGADKNGASPCAGKKRKAGPIRRGLPPEPPTGPIAGVTESYAEEDEEEREPLVDTPSDDDDYAINQAAAEASEPEAEDKEDYRARALKRADSLKRLKARRDPDGIEDEPSPEAQRAADREPIPPRS